MRNKRRKIVILTTGLMIIAICGLVYAAKVNEYSFTSFIKTGSVDVKIEQFQETENGEIEAFPGVVMPNMDVSYIPRVTNLRADSYVRVKMEIVMEEETPMPITTDCMLEVNEDWLLIGECFYYTKVMETNESSDILQGFHIPQEWTKDTASAFDIKLTCDAVQSEHFTPDFTSIAPWGDIEIETAKEEDNIIYGVAKEIETSPVLTYTANTGFESLTEDLFANFDHFMAGDTYKDTLTMENEGKYDINLYFKTENIETDLLKQMKLKIFCEEEIYYEGDLVSAEKSQWEKLCLIRKGEAKDLSFEIYLPEESQNYYSVLADNVVWKFKVEEIMPAVKTGDDANIAIYIALSLISAAAITLCVSKRKKKRGDPNV